MPVTACSSTGENYLVPIDATMSSEPELINGSVRLVDVMATLDSIPSRMRIAILDACRNNPFRAVNDAGRGLAMVDAPNGSIVAYSTAPGTEALDGDGEHSPYTRRRSCGWRIRRTCRSSNCSSAFVSR